jgi:hypothetical protein
VTYTDQSVYTCDEPQMREAFVQSKGIGCVRHVCHSPSRVLHMATVRSS